MDGTGLTGALGSISYMQNTGGYWVSPFESTFANLIFITPLDIHWWELTVPSMDSCAGQNDVYLESVSIYNFEEPNIRLTSNSQTIELIFDSTTSQFTGEDFTSAYSNNSLYSLSPFASHLVGFSINNIASTSSEPIVYSPAISGQSPPTITQNQVFSWSPSGADWIHIRLGRIDPSTFLYVEEVNCVAYDDGSFTIDGSLWNTWLTEQQIDIYFTRVVEQVAILPNNNSFSRVVGQHTIFGAGFSQ